MGLRVLVVWLTSVCLLTSPRVLARLDQSNAHEGAIAGRVDILRVAPIVERRPNVSDVGGPLERDLPDRLTSVVYLESAPRGAFDQAATGRAVMDQRNQTFVPHLLAVMVGTTVEFPNSDHYYHDVFSLSKSARFDLGRYPAGKSKSIRFERPGVVRVFCDIHSHMNGFILVFSHPFFSQTDAAGRYRIDHVPPGTYNVLAWNEGTSSEPKSVTVTDGGLSELDFTVR
jgi:plastocyanin